MQTGKLRQYVMLIVIGTVALTVLIKWSVSGRLLERRGNCRKKLSRPQNIGPLKLKLSQYFALKRN